MEAAMLCPVAAAVMAMLYTSLPMKAQEVGGIRLRGPGNTLNAIEQVQNGGCRLPRPASMSA
jgi:hypothetical protein